ncbi:4-hydroxy-tetrahydrodipicolinate synthase [Allostella sp. ATCC 35155]|nr:4-hydroxy-tetrahydrodipicolinate synthase [Stella sp. ATCC 35155]
MFKGSLVALVTPFRDGKVDEKAFQDFVAWQIAEGTNGLVPCGTTGESPTLSHAEHDRVIELCIEVAKPSKVPVMAGTGSNSTEEAIRLTKHAKKAGADAALIVTPYYNKPTQEGLYLHYKAIHDAVELPIYIYNIPGRSVINMTVETMERLARLPNIVGVKCATGDIQRPLLERVAIGDKWVQLSGDDGMALPYRAQGGDGCISVTANIAPRMLSEMHAAWDKGDVQAAMQINRRLMPLHEALFVETSPGPVKYAASLIGKSLADCRLPLAPTMDATRAKVKTAMTNAGLLN